MIVLEQDTTGVLRARYAFPWPRPRPWRRKIWRNIVEWLQDSARFEISVPRLPQTSSEHHRQNDTHHQ